MPNKLRVFVTHRAMRDYIAAHQSSDALLEKMLVIDDFEKRSQLFPGRRQIDEDQRNILLRKAADFEGFDLLKIERDFLRFIKSSSTILKFFEELAKESVAFEAIECADTYAEYENHLNVLKTLHARYQELLDGGGFVDGTNAPKIYRLNETYLKQIDEVHLYFEGYLSRYEVGLWERIAERVPTYLHLSTSTHTEKMHTRFSGLTLEANRNYILRLGEGAIAREEPAETDYDMNAYAVSSRLYQGAVVRRVIHDYVEKEGIAPERIAVILPDEAYVHTLALYDSEHNYNYAMGAPFTRQPLYRKLTALYDYRMEASHENTLRLQRLGIAPERYEALWNTTLDGEQIRQELVAWADEIEEEGARHGYLEQVHQMGKIFPELAAHTFGEIMHLFISRLAKLSTDLAGGGKVTVMGALESRGVRFDGVIVCDFNDGFVPKENLKDLYLNSAVRHHAGLPTRNDRQNLQLDLYHKLFSRAKKSTVIYVENEENIPSSFIKQLRLDPQTERAGEEYASLLYGVPESGVPGDAPIEGEFNLAERPLSATRLKDFITCKRRFYYKYIRNLREHEIPDDTVPSYLLGNLLHHALQEVYTTRAHYGDPAALKVDLEMALKRLIRDDIAVQFEGDIWLKRLEPFIAREVERFEQGFRIFSCEEEISLPFEGLTLEGRIDRIDERDGQLYVIDYKSGSFPKLGETEYEKIKDYQLVFYRILAGARGEVAEAAYYDLKEAALVGEPDSEAKLAMLRRRLEEYKAPYHRFDRTDEQKECTFCPYITLCGRE